MPKRQRQNDDLHFGPDNAANHAGGVTQLHDLEVQEVSLVDRPANTRKFLVVKAVMQKLGELLEGPKGGAPRSATAWPSDMNAVVEDAIDQLGDLLQGEDSFGADPGHGSPGQRSPGWSPDMAATVSKRGLTRTLAPLQLAVASALRGGGGHERDSLIAALERALEILRMRDGDTDDVDDEEEVA